jgi:selenocysteine-specific elongation factor
VIRSYSPVQVLGGGLVLDPMPPRGRAVWMPKLQSESATERLEALIARRPLGLELQLAPVILGVDAARLPELASTLPVENVGGVLVPQAGIAEAEQQALRLVRTHHAQHPSQTGVPLGTLRQGLTRAGKLGEAAVARLVARGELVVEGAIVREPAFRPSVCGGEALVELLVELVNRGGLSPPTVRELENTLQQPGISQALRLAARAGRLVAVERDRYFSPGALSSLTKALRTVAASGPITPAALREATGLSRKYLMPLLEWSDREGFTIRLEEARVAGPALTRSDGE